MKQKDTILYAHGSAYNHGCEAIVRSTVSLLSLDKAHTILYSNRLEGDLHYHIDDIITVKPIMETPVAHNSLLGYWYRALSHLHADHEKYYYRYFGKKTFRYLYEFGQAALSIGGDNYCYASAIDDLVTRNYWLTRKGFQTILWGASLSDTFLTPTVIEDMNRYALITVREKASMELLEKHHVSTNIICAPDPAFSLPVQDTPWPDGKEHRNVVGINISPFVIELSASGQMGLKNYTRLIQSILRETDWEIALIPHVVFPSNNNDILIAERLLEQLHEGERDRIVQIGDGYNCCELKSLISKCRFFVGARTHSTIAAYSTGVPTIVVGYSEKATGIARDLFGTAEDHVCPVQTLTEESMLASAFEKLVAKEAWMRQYLQNTIPAYTEQLQAAVQGASAIIFQ